MIEPQDKLELQLSFGPRALAIMGGSLGCVFLIWLIVGVAPHYMPTEWTSPLGDTYSAVSALFGGLAFAGVVVTILLQSMELRLQREELAETREELKRSATAQERSEQMLFLSAYMNTCSSLLDGYGRMFQQSEGGMRRVWYLAHSDMTAYVDALRHQVAVTGFPELVAVSHASVIRGRVARIANFVESQLVMIRRLVAEEQAAKINDVLETSRQLVTATRCLVDPQHCHDQVLPAELDALLDRLESELKSASTLAQADAVLLLLRRCAGGDS
ncbi:hypothetical protein [Anatilimnocola floriformis]|uniref:hypothetical protein n=1 Tax=Anatilimnocola floriformis TaxID=2948575 RepID=UPI0020C49460|nr:hypothetical protein [Anatilimnocola floriformis]